MSTPPGDFSQLKLRTFASPGFGLVLNAPEQWRETGDTDAFQVSDPQTGAQVTASAFENPGIPLEQWAEYRLGLVVQTMPDLHQVRAPRELPTLAGPGVAGLYEGRFPDAERVSRYLVLCLRTDKLVVSVTVTADKESFEKQEALYDWLLRTQLDIYQVERRQA